MRTSLARLAYALSVVLVAGCAAAPSPSVRPPAAGSSTNPAGVASPTAATSATLSPILSTAPSLPTSSPTTSGWPFQALSGRTAEPVFGPDGTVYLLAGARDGEDELHSLVALDTVGRAKPGWPIEEPPGSDFGSPAVGPDGSIYFEECGGSEVGCVLHRLGSDGRELPGWPFEMPPDFACPGGSGLCSSLLDIASNGTAYMTHWRDAGGEQAIAIDPSGQLRPGWPVSPVGQGLWWSNAQLGSDGTLFMLGMPDGVEGPASLAAVSADGTRRAGWPVSVPDIRGYLLGPQGTVVTWSLIDDVGELCSNPRRTLFTVLGPDGKTLPGWPRGSTGFASPPVVDDQGTVYYVSELGNVYAHDRAGEIKGGWPVAVPGAGNGCGPASPYLASDGTVYVLGEEVEARSPDGRSRPGWPYRPVGDLIAPIFSDTDAIAYPHAPAFGPDGTVYLVLFHTDAGGARAEVVALDRQGQLKAGWPYRLSFDLTSVEIGPLTVSPDGRLFIRGGSLLFALDPDGRLSD